MSLWNKTHNSTGEQFPEAPTSRQSICLNQWTPDIRCAPTCKGPTETRVLALALPAPMPERRPVSSARGARKPAKLRAAPGRCSECICPTGTSTAPRSTRRKQPAAHPSARRRRRATHSAKRVWLSLGLGSSKEGDRNKKKKSEQTLLSLRRTPSLPLLLPRPHLGSRSCSRSWSRVETLASGAQNVPRAE